MADSINQNPKLEQVLIIEPKNVLHFKGPYTDIVTRTLKLTNPTERRVCFKVKTTAPRRYCVRPNNGVVEPKSNTQISVMLQPFDFDSKNDNRNKHKFMIQTMFEPDEEVDQETMWKQFADEIMNSKLKCVFDNHLDKPSVPSSIQGVNENAMDLIQYSEQSTKLAESEEGELFSSTPPYKANDEGRGDMALALLAEENKRLKEENAAIRRELMQQREEGLKRRVLAVDQSYTASETQTKSGPKNPGSLDLISVLANPQVMVLILAALVLGLFVGKVMF